MKKILHIAVTVVIMLVVSRFIVRIIDATVQIDDDIGLVLLLVAAIAWRSSALCSCYPP